MQPHKADISSSNSAYLRFICEEIIWLAESSMHTYCCAADTQGSKQYCSDTAAQTSLAQDTYIAVPANSVIIIQTVDKFAWERFITR